MCAEIGLARKQQGTDKPGSKIKLTTPPGDTEEEIKARSVWAQQTISGRKFLRAFQSKLRDDNRG